MLDRAPAMGYEICNFDDDMGQSVLDQQEQNTIWREEEQFKMLMMAWDRACWTSRNRTLFGKKKNSYAISDMAG